MTVKRFAYIIILHQVLTLAGLPLLHNHGPGAAFAGRDHSYSAAQSRAVRTSSGAALHRDAGACLVCLLLSGKLKNGPAEFAAVAACRAVFFSPPLLDARPRALFDASLPIRGPPAA